MAASHSVRQRRRTRPTNAMMTPYPSFQRTSPERTAADLKRHVAKRASKSNRENECGPSLSL
jgi:hypothetical protein